MWTAGLFGILIGSLAAFMLGTPTALILYTAIMCGAHYLIGYFYAYVIWGKR